LPCLAATSIPASRPRVPARNGSPCSSRMRSATTSSKSRSESSSKRPTTPIVRYVRRSCPRRRGSAWQVVVASARSGAPRSETRFRRGAHSQVDLARLLSSPAILRPRDRIGDGGVVRGRPVRRRRGQSLLSAPALGRRVGRRLLRHDSDRQGPSSRLLPVVQSDSEGRMPRGRPRGSEEPAVAQRVVRASLPTLQVSRWRGRREPLM
jgi:hypothetical protein